MPASNVLNNRTAAELGDSVRRLLNDTDTEKSVIPAASLREMVIAQYILTQHEYGWNPQIPLRPTTGAQMLSYSLAAGAYQTTQEGESDVIAVTQVWTDRHRNPLEFKPREVIEGWINDDVARNGAVTKGPVAYWTMRIDWTGSPPTEMKTRMLVYPSADRATIIYWPRTVVDTEAVDPSSTGKMPLSYQGLYGLEFKIAALLVKALNDESLKSLRIDRGFFDVLWQEWTQARDRERSERAMHTQEDFVRQLQA